MKYYFVFVVACCLIPSILNAPTSNNGSNGGGGGKGHKASLAVNKVAGKGKNLASKAVKTATEIGENPLVETGVNLALQTTVDPVTLATAKAAVKGVQKLHETGSVVEAGQAVFDSGVTSSSGAVDVFKNGADLIKDIHGGKNIKESVLHRGKEAVKNLPGGQNVALGIDAANDLLDGKGFQEVAMTRGKEAIQQNVPGIDIESPKCGKYGLLNRKDKKQNGKKLKHPTLIQHFTLCVHPETDSGADD